MGAITGRAPRELIAVLGIEPREIDDPGNAGTISTSRPGYVNLVTLSGNETRTLPDPKYIGQELDLFFYSFGGGTCTITSSSPVNQSGHTSLPFLVTGNHVRLVGHYNPTDGWEWRVICADGVTPA